MFHLAYEVNQYVIFKYKDEWQEGRIIDAVVSDSSDKDNRTYYKILSLKTLLEVPTLLFDHILLNNSENIKKVKFTADKLPISKEIRALIEFDREMVSKNKMYKGSNSMGDILSDFNEFLYTTKCNLSKEEVSLGTEGLKFIFDSLLEKVLMSSKEMKYFEALKKKMAKKKAVTPLYLSFGIVYAIRIVYYILKSLMDRGEEQEVRSLLFEFLVYFLDFCGLQIEKYFNKKSYE